MFSVNPNQEPSNRTSQQTRFNKKKTGAEESFVLDFAYNPEAIERLYSSLGGVAAKEQWQEITGYMGYDGQFKGNTFKDVAPNYNAEWPSPMRPPTVNLEVPILSSKTFIFGYADIVVDYVSRGHRWNISVPLENPNVMLRGEQQRLSLLIEVKSERTSVLDLIKQLKSYSQFHPGLPVFIHLYDLEEREIRALKANGIHPVDGSLLV